jgi:hypothetical protein
MPKVHNIGSNHFIQYTKFPYKWDGKLLVRGWTQEIEEPYRTSEPFIVRLPNYRALVLGRWSGMKNEEEALNGALERRDVTYDDFTEEAGWTPAPDTCGEAGRQDIYSRFNLMDGAVDVYIGQELDKLAKTSE